MQDNKDRITSFDFPEHCKMKLNPVTLSFSRYSESMEQEFFDDYFKKSLNQVRFASLLALFFYAIFGLFDALLIPEMKGTFWLIRYAVVCPCIFAGILFTFSPYFKKFMQVTLFVLITLAGFGIVLMIVLPSPSVNSSHYAGLILVFMFAYGLVRARFIWATLACWTIVVFYEIAATWINPSPLPVLINNNFFFISANIIGMFVCYSIEYYERRDFFLTSLLENEKEKAYVATRAKSRFLANMSHELRTPLNSIIGFTELVVDRNFGDLNDVQEEYLNDALQSSRHLLSLINDILDLSKVEAGKLELQISDVNLRELLENSLVMVNEKAMKHGLKISTQLNEMPETIHADERKLKQIVYNLLSNAVKFTPSGGAIRLSANVVASDGNFIEISVEDTGIGIAKEDLERIFNPFEQADGLSSRSYKGTGLGLSLAKQLVELHKGRIWAESKGKGKGSTFRFVIPV